MMHTVLVAQSSWVLFHADAQYQPLGKALDYEDPNLLPVGIYVVMSPGTLAVECDTATKFTLSQRSSHLTYL